MPSAEMKIQHEWQEFERSLLPPDANKTRRDETRRAFFTGAFAVLVLLGGSGPGLDTNLWVELLDEARQFGQDQIARRGKSPHKAT